MTDDKKSGLCLETYVGAQLTSLRQATSSLRRRLGEHARHVRRSVTQPVEDLGAALACLLGDAQQRLGMVCRLILDESVSPSDDLAGELFRIVDDALVELLGPAEVRRLTVEVAYHEGVLTLTLTGDGRWPHVAALELSHRAEALGGRVTLARGADGGRLRVAIPCLEEFTADTDELLLDAGSECVPRANTWEGSCSRI